MIRSLDEYIIFDIETYTIKDNALKVAKNTKPKIGNLKDPDKIAAKEDEHISKIVSQGALSWFTGEIRSIAAYSYYTDEWAFFYYPFSISDAQFLDEENAEAHCYVSEKDLLDEFYEWVGKKKLIGMNSRMFDLPFLIGRSLANSVPMPFEVKNYKQYTCDISDLLSYSITCGQRTSLSNYAMALGIDGKSSDGSKFKQMMDNGCHEDIMKYNMQDVQIVKDFLDRFCATREKKEVKYEDLF